MTRMLLPLCTAAFLAAGACEVPEPEVDPADDPAVTDPAEDPRVMEAEAVTAVAQIVPIADRDVRGQATFRSLNGQLHVEAHVSGLDPDRRHGFHIHEGSSCEDPGDHLAPRGHEHGGPGDPRDERHKGDLGNLETDDAGTASYERTIEDVELREGDAPIIGHVVVVHERRDDLETDPDGDAGEPIACGVIEPMPTR